MAKLRTELEQFRHYFTIIETRLGGRVQTFIEVEERWLDTEVPKMILQPIVENAVKYGLEPLNRPGTLRVYSREAEDGRLEIVVEDDGVGMDELTLERIERTLADHPESESEPEPDSSAESDKSSAGTDGASGVSNDGGPRERRGIGLLNVHRRIRLLFGEGYGLRIESKEGLGTSVIASFPGAEPGLPSNTSD